jgi:outer membrane receptor protein involved in Fe transport
LYVSDRFQLTARTRAELGLRWDKQTYLGPVDDDQFSPRASLFHEIGDRTELRLSWGRYHQSQGIQELQVEDGVARFFPAQRSDHLIAGIQYRFPNRYRIRAEAYLKEYDDLRPRFENLQDSLALIPELEPDRARIAPDSGKSRGFELTVESHGNDEFDWWASYSLSRVTDSIEGRNEKRNSRNATGTSATPFRPVRPGTVVPGKSAWPSTFTAAGQPRRCRWSSSLNQYSLIMKTMKMTNSISSSRSDPATPLTSTPSPASISGSAASGCFPTVGCRRFLNCRTLSTGTMNAVSITTSRTRTQK